MKALKIIFIILFAIIALFFVFVLFLPSSAETKQSETINTPALTVFKQVNNLQNWEQWSPLKQKKPELEFTYEGSELGVGAVQIWKVNSKEKIMKIVESQPYQRILMEKITYADETPVDVFWTFVEKDGKTDVTWGINVEELSYPFGRFMAFTMSDKTEKYFKQGLENLKKYCENLPPYPKVEITKTQEIIGLAIKDSANANTMGQKMSEMYGELMTYTFKKKIQMAGYPFTIWYSWDMDKPMVFAAAIPMIKKYDGKGRIFPIKIAPTEAVTALHKGSYNSSDFTWMAIDEFIKEHKLVSAGDPWETYITDPTNEPDTSKWETRLYWPIKDGVVE